VVQAIEEPHTENTAGVKFVAIIYGGLEIKAGRPVAAAPALTVQRII
jgi:hypothetical protein